ncbi:hypothetical protein [Rhodoplanes azumiensis]|uniref:DUF4178 domain-containing protein n=1 Tax=Rhodoplanes azumiensis TaxID=1897628 RepID=A0ABW5AE05_9BRAD
MRSSRLSGLRLVPALAVSALAALALAACAPPAELDRPPAPPAAAARALLPPGRSEAVALPDAVAAAAVDTATVTTSDGRLTAARFATPEAARHGFGALADAVDRRAGPTSRSRVAVGALHYMRYAGPGLAGLVWASGPWLFAAEAASPEQLAGLIAASRVGGIEDTGAATWVLIASLAGVAVLLLLIGLLVRRILRSAVVAPAPGVVPVPRDALLARLKALDDPSRPWQVRSAPDADLVVEWKYADAAWWGVMAEQGVRETYRLRLYLDEARHRVGARDEVAAVEWSAGMLPTPRFTVERQGFRGVQLARKKREVAYGFDTPTGGGFGKKLDVRFDLDTLKAPVVATVTQAGWSYVPVLRPWR